MNRIEGDGIFDVKQSGERGVGSEKGYRQSPNKLEVLPVYPRTAQTSAQTRSRRTADQDSDPSAELQASAASTCSRRD